MGTVGQLLLLTRWSPHAQTDLFLLLGIVPWLMSAALLVGGLEMALPAAYHRALAAGGEEGARQFVGQVTVLAGLVAAGAALVGGIIVAGWAAWAGMDAPLALWMGLALGGQVVPASLAGLWRGLLVARDRLVRARLTLLAGSLLTMVGYALLPPPPALALPLTALAAAVLVALLSWVFNGWRSCWERPGRWKLHPETARLPSALVALGAASGLVHVRSMTLRAAVLPLGAGVAAALAAAERHWDALLTILVAASVAPVFPRWAEARARFGGSGGLAGRLMRWSLARMAVLALVAAAVFGAAAWLLAPVLEGVVGWRVGAETLRMVLVLLPYFLLLACVQPLVMKHYAQGSPWPPVLGAALGVAVLGLGVLVLVPGWHAAGVALAAAASAVPGLLYLGWREWREAQRCAC